MWYTLRYWLSFAVVITSLSALVYIVVQQNYRQSANDPQIQLAKDIADDLSNGAKLQALGIQGSVNIASSLAPFVMIYDKDRNPVLATAVLSGKTPNIPEGVLNAAGRKGENRVTWQPKRGVRSAIVVVSYPRGYVLVGRSLTEVEKRIEQLGMLVCMLWLMTMVASFLAVLLFFPKAKKK